MRREIVVCAPYISKSYLNNPEATKNALNGEWLITGDLSRLDNDGFVFIEGRLSRFSKIGGEMVPHTTVESALNIELGFADSDVPKIAISKACFAFIYFFYSKNDVILQKFDYNIDYVKFMIYNYV